MQQSTLHCVDTNHTYGRVANAFYRINNINKILMQIRGLSYI